MSRSLGDLVFTTCPPISSSPEVMSSRPAIMFSVVDLPQPDGPTRMTNSPSAILRLKSLTANDPALEEQHEDYDRDGDDHRGGRDRTRRNGEYRSAAEVLHGGRRRPGADR